MNLRRLVPLLLALAALAALPLPAVARDASNPLLIGVLASLTGSWSSLGLTTQAATQLAADDANQEFANAGVRSRVRIRIEDTRLDPDRALGALKRLAGRGVRVVVGPQSSAEVRKLLPYAAQRGILLISQGSTAGSLAIPNDNVFRFCPADTHEGPAAAALMYADGIRAMVPAWRADAGNQGLHTSTAAAFQALGGSASAGIEYSDTNPDFAAVVSALEAQVLQAQGQVGAGAVGVYLASFDETVQLFHAAANSPILSGVKWYGGDGVVQSQALQDDLPAAQFAATVGFPCPTFGLDASARAIWEPLSTRIQNKTGFAPDAFGLAAYDATRVAAIANLEASIHAGINARRAALTATANRHFGATGWCLLDTAGDRAIGNFDFYALRPAGAGFTWQLVARYTNGQIVRE